MCPQFNLADPPVKTDPLEAARTLGNLLTQTLEYKAFFAALRRVNSDLTIQKLSAEMRDHQAALHWGRDLNGQHTAELTRLELEMEDQPLVKEYREAAKVISALFQAVDQVISQEAGVEFAINAQRRGCDCGR